jgi:uncharacterized protein
LTSADPRPRSRYLAIRATGTKGAGVVCTEPMNSGATVAVFHGMPRWIWDIPKRDWDHALQFDYDRYLVPRRGSFGWYINHSCDPNCVVRGSRRIVAWRDIRRGEEITFDYSTNVGWERFAMKCCCGAACCRGVVRCYSRLSPSLKRRYGGNISPYLIRGAKPSSAK